MKKTYKLIKNRTELIQKKTLFALKSFIFFIASYPVEVDREMHSGPRLVTVKLDSF